VVPRLIRSRAGGSSSDNDREYLLAAETTVIGRSEDCDIRLNDTGVSRRHGEVQRTSDGQFLYIDAGSMNGSIVNGRPAKQVKLVEGDRIELGGFILTFRREAGRGSDPSADRRRVAPSAEPSSAYRQGDDSPKTMTPFPDIDPDIAQSKTIAAPKQQVSAEKAPAKEVRRPQPSNDGPPSHEPRPAHQPPPPWWASSEAISAVSTPRSTPAFHEPPAAAFESRAPEPPVEIGPPPPLGVVGEASPVASGVQVFLCHSHGDKEAVRDLNRRLRADGFTPWLDEEELVGGQDWKLEIRKAIAKSKIVLACLSESSVTKRGFVQTEIKFALDVADEQPEGQIYLIPVRLESCDVPERLSSLHGSISSPPTGTVTS
jgi:pSer/pThr/pTyr-binding forkhead associated (FHA) protein